MTTALLCPSCGDPVVEDDDFCESCGTRLRPPARAEEGACPKCGAGAEQTDRDGYCGRCGYRLGRTTDHVEVEMDAGQRVHQPRRGRLDPRGEVQRIQELAVEG